MRFSDLKLAMGCARLCRSSGDEQLINVACSDASLDRLTRRIFSKNNTQMLSAQVAGTPSCGTEIIFVRAHMLGSSSRFRLSTCGRGKAPRFYATRHYRDRRHSAPTAPLGNFSRSEQSDERVCLAIKAMESRSAKGIDSLPKFVRVNGAVYFRVFGSADASGGTVLRHQIDVGF